MAEYVSQQMSSIKTPPSCELTLFSFFFKNKSLENTVDCLFSKSNYAINFFFIELIVLLIDYLIFGVIDSLTIDFCVLKKM